MAREPGKTPDKSKAARGMRRYRRLQGAVAGILLVMFVAGEAALLRPSTYEVFPFYSWSMFALVPNKTEQFYVFVTKDGVTREYTRAKKWLGESANSVIAYTVIQQYGKALRSGNKKEIANWRRQFEENHIPDDLDYEVRYSKEDPMVRWRQERMTEVPVWAEMTVVGGREVAP
jgi:hypothetical protein